jgi:hypothetical protein
MLTLMSRRSLRAAENATAISAAAPTSGTMMNPTKAGLIPPNVSPAYRDVGLAQKLTSPLLPYNETHAAI